MSNSNKNQQTRLINAFRTAKNGLSARQIANRLNTSTSRARFLITELRQEGYPIYTNRKTFDSGYSANVYRIGTVRRSVVADAVRSYGSSVLR